MRVDFVGGESTEQGRAGLGELLWWRKRGVLPSLSLRSGHRDGPRRRRPWAKAEQRAPPPPPAWALGWRQRMQAFSLDYNDSAHPQGQLAVSGDSFVTAGGEGATGIWWVGVRDAAGHLSRTGQPPTQWRTAQPQGSAVLSLRNPCHDPSLTCSDPASDCITTLAYFLSLLCMHIRNCGHSFSYLGVFTRHCILVKRVTVQASRLSNPCLLTVNVLSFCSCEWPTMTNFVHLAFSEFPSIF